MEAKLKRMGLKRAFIRTAISGFFILILVMSIRMSWDEYDLRDTIFWVFAISTLSMIIIVNCIRTFQGGSFREIQEFCNQSTNPEVMLARIEKVWNEGFTTRHCRIDKEYFVWVRKMRSMVIPLSDIDGIQCETWIHGKGLLELADLCIYLKDGTSKRLTVKRREGLAIEEHFLNNTKGIVVGALACKERRLYQECNVGKINFRYRIIKLGNPERYFIIDFANPRKLRNYGPFSAVLALVSKGEDRSWSAWEITRAELRDIKHKPFKGFTLTYPIAISCGIIFAQLGRVFFTYDTISSDILLKVLGGVFLILLVFVNISTFRVDKYPAVKIVEKESKRSQINKRKEAVFILIFLGVALCIFLHAVIMAGSIHVIAAAVAVLLMLIAIFEKFINHPKIDARHSIILSAKNKNTNRYKKVKSKNKRRIIQWKKSYR